MRNQLDPEKAIEALLYTANRLDGNVYKALKAIYHAEKHHLEEFGSQIYGEAYDALMYGPVPEFAYKVVRGLREQDIGVELSALENFEDSFDITQCTERYLAALRNADMDYFSKSDIESLDVGVAAVQGKSFTKVKDESHDEAYNATSLNSTMALATIVSSLNDGPKISQHLNRNAIDEFDEL